VSSAVVGTWMRLTERRVLSADENGRVVARDVDQLDE
jgi:hypothetical protein